MRGTIIVIIAMVIIGVSAIIADIILLRKRGKESSKFDNAISRVMKNYKHITMSLLLAERFLEALKYNKDKALVIYESENDPQSFVFVIKQRDDVVDIDVGRDPKWTATSENFEVVRREMREYAQKMAR